MSTNKDGLEPGKPVDFTTHQRILREQREARHASKAAPKAGRRRIKTPMGDLDDTQSAKEAGDTPAF